MVTKRKVVAVLSAAEKGLARSPSVPGSNEVCRRGLDTDFHKKVGKAAREKAALRSVCCRYFNLSTKWEVLSLLSEKELAEKE